ncbi:MAG: hypothetical protein GY832_36545 [Chloroflexi bacterium]|nr:hypothetical protein [Chloroflexota bacterium]
MKPNPTAIAEDLQLGPTCVRQFICKQRRSSFTRSDVSHGLNLRRWYVITHKPKDLVSRNTI